MSSDALPLAAAILDTKQPDVGQLLARIVRQQLDAGRRLRGCLMERHRPAEGDPARMELVDITNGERYLVSQPMGSASKACRADPQGFARASALFRTALQADPAPELVISNRYGDLEVRGGGFSAELLEVMAQGLPLLTTVSEGNAAAWQAFTGGAVLLPADEAQINGWIEQTLAAAQG